MSKAARIKRAMAENLFGELGCYDSGCVYGYSGGMATNGGCGCLKETDITELRRTIRRLSEIAYELAGVVATAQPVKEVDK